ncbi:hypothetical protein BSKO_05025 [Bryopsis sp. KO-2023]|nr:hypothetical protein BSKO_05025 [Bryopsis sp. KO-2023]
MEFTFLGTIFTLYDVYLVVLNALISMAVALTVVISVDRLLHVVKFIQGKIKARVTGVRPEQKFKLQPMPDQKHFAHMYPKVAVQLPMFNERFVCEGIIDHACQMDWPKDKYIVQVLDDSTCAETRRVVDSRVIHWREMGVNCVCIRRTNRQGYKAGALKEGLDLLRDYDHVAIFDADFKPQSDFMLRTIPYLIHNDDVGYVQARWVFENPEESYLTKAQELSLNYHMKCEQHVHFASGSYFNFNGTAGVWRRQCIEDVGGWNSRTTVEDMDLSLRAYVGGWRAVFLEDLTVMNELPASFNAYRKQQHRWTCGPVQLWRRASPAIWASKLPLMKKIELNMMYFGIRKTTSHFIALGFFCFLVPLTVYTPEVSIPLWALVHLPVMVTLTTAFFTPKGWAYCIPYVLFENAMSVVKVGAVVNGLFDLGRAQEWIVTQKNGNKNVKSSRFRLERVYVAETVMSIFVLSSAAYGSFLLSRWTFCVFLLLQGAAFVGVGLNFVDSGAILGRGVYKIDPLLNRLTETLTPRKKGFRRVNTAPSSINVAQ